jgi:hypothetical protein
MNFLEQLNPFYIVINLFVMLPSFSIAQNSKFLMTGLIVRNRTDCNETQKTLFVGSTNIGEPDAKCNATLIQSTSFVSTSLFVNQNQSTQIANNGLCPEFDSSAFGDNVIMIEPSMRTAAIQEIFDVIYSKQVNNEMGDERYSLYFLPGTYGSLEEPLSLLIGYYTEVAGLGASPSDVVINGKIEVYNRCFEAGAYSNGKFIPTSFDQGGVCFALNNFWRTLTNLSISIVHKANLDPCRKTAMFWAISQASVMRRIDITGGDLSLMDYCTSTFPMFFC